LIGKLPPNQQEVIRLKFQNGFQLSGNQPHYVTIP